MGVMFETRRDMLGDTNAPESSYRSCLSRRSNLRHMGSLNREMPTSAAHTHPGALPGWRGRPANPGPGSKWALFS